jgi:hypothetical protein
VEKTKKLKRRKGKIATRKANRRNLNPNAVLL